MQYGDELDDDSEIGHRLREKLSVSLKEQDKLIASSGTLLGYRYNNSPIIISDGTEETIDNPRKYIPTARPGHRAPHIWLEEGISIYDKFDKNFTLLVFSEDIKKTENFFNKAKSINFPLTVLEINDKDAFNLYEYSFVLIRPDLMVAWRSNTMPDNPFDVIDIVRGSK
jgi:hypothetical protein